MAALALPEVRRTHTLVPEHPDSELDRPAGAVRELPPADLRLVHGTGGAGGDRFPDGVSSVGLRAFDVLYMKGATAWGLTPLVGWGVVE